MDALPIEARDESARWARLVEACRAVLPELDGWLGDDLAGDPTGARPATPGDLATTVSMRMFESKPHTPKAQLLDVWSRLLGFLEVVEEAIDLVTARDPEGDDVTTLEAFANAGILCEVGWTREGAERLLPLMGMRTATAFRRDVDGHRRVEREWDGRDLDWAVAATRFERIPLAATEVLPDDLVTG